MSLTFTATSTRQEIAQRCASFNEFLETLQRLRREHPSTKLDADCLYSTFKSFCSTKRKTSRKHGCEGHLQLGDAMVSHKGIVAVGDEECRILLLALPPDTCVWSTELIRM
ncbi:MAG: hypothetical protein ACREBW_04300 [Candidatus Micrarchaeaceae archaeon]